MTLTPYKRKAFYYETDRMDIIHHSNYVRWLEEARVDLMEQLGCPFHEIEARGIVSPVLSVETHYKYPVRLTLPLRKQPALPTPPTASPTPTLSL